MATVFRAAESRPSVSAAAPSIIELDHVTKQFQGKRQVTALDDVSLTIPPGQMVSIIGPSGSGKSTLLNLVGGLDRPTSGDVGIDGEALAGLSDDGLTRVRRDKIGFIFQFFNLLPTLSCLENVGLPLHLRGWPRKKVDERARELLTLVAARPPPRSIFPTSSRAASGSASRSPARCRLSADPARRRADRQSRHADRRGHPWR